MDEARSTIAMKNEPRFTTRELALLGVLAALATVLQTGVAIVFHATGIAAVPGLMHFLMSFVAAVILYTALRKVPKPWALTLLAIVYSLVVMLVSGGIFHGIGLIVGGVLGDLYAKASGGYASRWTPIISLTIYRFCQSSSREVHKLITEMTQVDIVWWLIGLGIVGSVIGAFVGGITGRSLNDRLTKSGAIQ